MDNRTLKGWGWASWLACGLIVGCGLCGGGALAAEGAAATEQESALIALLKSDAPPGDKAIACKKLAIYGSPAAVPVLAPLLADPHLASWARIALEAIPGPEADAALLDSLPALHGRLLVGAIDSLGVRRVTRATDTLLPDLKNNDPEVASAAAAALGRIGGARAARGLRRSLRGTPPEVRSTVAQACVECAESFLAQGKRHAAVALYDAVRRADVPKSRKLEATRGAILARGSRGIRLLTELLRSEDKATFRVGLQVARELPGHQATLAVAKELERSPEARQPLLLLALADRGDDLASPIVSDAAKRGPKPVRLVALRILENRGKLASVPVLLEAAADPDDEVAAAALGSLTRLSAYGADDQICSDLTQATGKRREVLIQLAGKRQIKAAVPMLLKSAQDTNPEIRRASLDALETVGDQAQVPALVQMLQGTQNITDRLNLERTLVAICGRAGAACAHDVVPLAGNPDAALRVAALHILAATGGPESLAAVEGCVRDKDEAVQDEAVRTLATWPNTWPEDAAIAEPLLNLAKSSSKPSHQILALRGYLSFLQGDKSLAGAEKASKVSQVVPLLGRPDEKRLAIATLRDLPTVETLRLLTTFAQEPAVAEDACSAIVTAAAHPMGSVAREDREAALKLVLEKSSNPALKSKAQAALNSLK